MAFDPKQDVIHKAWEHVGGLRVQIGQYAKGEKKIQIGPRNAHPGQEMTYARHTGRVTLEELEWIVKMMPEIRKEIERKDEPEPEKTGGKDARKK